MKNEITNVIDALKNVNSHLNIKDSDFDQEDVIETFERSKLDVNQLIKQLEKCDLDKKDILNKLLVHIELDFAHLVWVLEEIREHIKNTVIKL